MGLSYVFAGAVAAAAPLMPAGKWTVEFGARMCVASRIFGTGNEAVSVALRPLPLARAMEVIVVRAGTGNGRSRSGAGSLTLDPAGATLDGQYVSWVGGKPVRQVLMLTLVQADRGQMQQAATWRLDYGPTTSIAVTPGFSAAVTNALATCEATLLREWGIDPAEDEKTEVAAQSIGSPGSWISANDYPRGALARGLGGTIEVMFRVEADGSIGPCRNLRDTGSTDINAIACKLIYKRARYKAALDRHGQSMATHKILRFTFSPGELPPHARF